MPQVPPIAAVVPHVYIWTWGALQSVGEQQSAFGTQIFSAMHSLLPLAH